MYLRPRSVFENFLVYEKRQRISDIGRQKVEYVPVRQMCGVLSAVKPTEREKLGGVKHETSHLLIQKRGPQAAQVGDLFLKGERKYLCLAVENPCGIGQFWLYYVTERADL